ncbi:hypothetical protein MMC17_007870 [Xylographa soralifera]|nr:hypothetical protein [Xylographa soralifera]
MEPVGQSKLASFEDADTLLEQFTKTVIILVQWLEEKFVYREPPGSSTWDVVAGSSTAFWNVTFVVPSTSFGTIPAQTATPTYNTTWFIPTATLNISTSTVTANLTQISQLAALTVDCPITGDDYAAGWSIYDLPDDCTDALVEYCQPVIDATQPPPTTFPTTCSPIYYENSTTTQPSTTVVPSTTSSTLVPTQSGIAANCDAFYTVQSGDSCSAITDKFANFTLAQFYSWNPAVGSSCQYLDLGYAVCIGVPGVTASSTATSAPATSSTAGLTTTSSTTMAPSATVPSPLEPSTDPQCTQYHQVVSGDGCYAIEQTYGITAAQVSTTCNRGFLFEAG